MSSLLFKTAIFGAFSSVAISAASAHVNYAGRNFGIFSGTAAQSTTISNQTVPSNFGWADATDIDFGHSHQVRPFRFTLESTTRVTFSVSSQVPGFLPGFSIYLGLAHLAPLAADYDDSNVSLAYLATLSGTHEGAFNALADFQMGNDDTETGNGTIPGELTSFLFRGYAVDGTSANYGTAPGVNGDGLADGTVSGTFDLGPGIYTIFIGGANYAGQGPVADTGIYGITATLSTQVVPEPATATLAAAGLLLTGLGRPRRRRGA